MEFSVQGKPIKLHGVVDSPMHVSPITTTQLYKGTKGNDTWTFFIIDSLPPPQLDPVTPTPPCIQAVLDEHKQVF
jgi:hypothetical protein